MNDDILLEGKTCELSLIATRLQAGKVIANEPIDKKNNIIHNEPRLNSEPCNCLITKSQ